MCLDCLGIYFFYTSTASQKKTKKQNGLGAGIRIPYLLAEYENMEVPQKLRHNISKLHT